MVAGLLILIFFFLLYCVVATVATYGDWKDAVEERKTHRRKEVEAWHSSL